VAGKVKEGKGMEGLEKKGDKAEKGEVGDENGMWDEKRGVEDGEGRSRKEREWKRKTGMGISRIEVLPT